MKPKELVLNQNKLIELYKNVGAFNSGVPYSPETIKKWLSVIETNYSDDTSNRSGGRQYVTADVLHKCGVLGEIFTPNIKNIILTLEPNPVLFHCHAYSIPHSVKDNHIGFLEHDGWHRDFVEPSMISKSGCRAFSIFIYLTDVIDETNGVFELLPSYFEDDKIMFKKSHRFKGKAGTCFFWDRSLYHRPHPNTAGVSRQLIKLSFQSNGFKNSRIELPEFKNIVKNLKGQDSFMHYVVGGCFKDTHDFEPYEEIVMSDALEITKIEPNSRTIYRPKVRPILKRIKNRLISAS